MLTPTLFIGHGNPMYSIEKNEFSQTWEQLGKKLTIPSAIICISAHWETNGTELTAAVRPDTIHDFNGFPRKLFEVLYLPIGAPKLTHYIQNTLPKENIVLNPHRGLDHGAWSILRNMYPEANIPIIQLSIDRTKSPLEHYELGKKLSFLRKENIMIIGSGNIVHNLYKVDFDNPQNAYSWAINANNMIKTLLKKTNLKHSSIIKNWVTTFN
jgi:4,5-DOPA dioxygenase extradiol